MSKTEAFALLDITAAALLIGSERGESLYEIVARHFKRAARAGHPDTGGTQGDMDLLLQAKKIALCEDETRNSACMLCLGAGSVRQKVGTVRCVACKGTGEKYGHAK